MIKTAYSTKKSVEEVAQDLKMQLSAVEPKMVVYFASSSYDQQALANAMGKIFADAGVFGCSTSGEIVSGQMLKNSVVAMAFDTAAISDYHIEVVENLKNDVNVDGAVKSFESYYGESMKDMDFRTYAGVVLADGLSLSEENLIDKIGNVSNILFVGGSAGDDLKFEATHVYANGKAYTNAAVIAVFKPVTEFDIIKTQSFCSINKPLVATKVNEEAREVIEFNGKPAAEAYAEALGVSRDTLADEFMSHPVGLMIEGEPYVRSPQQIKGDSVVFYCNILDGMEMTVLESEDIIADTKKAIEEKKQELGSISAIINFHCILRTLQLESHGKTEDYGKVFSDIPTIGFSTYGEIYIGHINQTSTMLVFK